MEPVVNPDPGGTRIMEVVGNDKTEIGFSTSWTIAENHSGNGCASKIDRIVVAPTVDEARIAERAVALVQKPGIASSSFSSFDVTKIELREDGTQATNEVRHLLVANSFVPPGSTIPIATEIWFSREPFLDREAVLAAERNCKGEVRPIPQS